MPRKQLALTVAEKNLTARLYFISRICFTLTSEFDNPRLNDLIRCCEKHILHCLDDIEFAFGLPRLTKPPKIQLAWAVVPDKPKNLLDSQRS